MDELYYFWRLFVAGWVEFVFAFVCVVATWSTWGCLFVWYMGLGFMSLVCVLTTAF